VGWDDGAGGAPRLSAPRPRRAGGPASPAGGGHRRAPSPLFVRNPPMPLRRTLRRLP